MCLEIYFQSLVSNFEKREKKTVFYFWFFPMKKKEVAIFKRFTLLLF